MMRSGKMGCSRTSSRRRCRELSSQWSDIWVIDAAQHARPEILSDLSARLDVMGRLEPTVSQNDVILQFVVKKAHLRPGSLLLTGPLGEPDDWQMSRRKVPVARRAVSSPGQATL